METKDDVGVGVKIINGNDAIEILKVMSKNTKIYEVSPILVELINSNINLAIEAVKYVPNIYFQLSGQFRFNKKLIKAIKGFEDIETGILKWPMSVIRIRSKNSERLIELADYILNKWKNYTDKDVFIISETNGQPHNTITPIARKKNDTYELDLVLRNNITTDEHPLGVYHPHEEFHHIKKENIGLIEVMGLAVLPSRLQKELAEVAKLILEKSNLNNNLLTEKHADWVKSFLPKYNEINKNNIMQILEYETGLVFVKVLECAGVFKRDQKGQDAFKKFICAL